MPFDARADTGGAGSSVGCVTAQAAWARAGVTATLAVVLGALLHDVAGGDAATTWWLAVGFAGALLTARLAQGRLGSPTRTVAALVLGQVLVHVCLPMSGRGPGSGLTGVGPHVGPHLGGMADGGSPAQFSGAAVPAPIAGNLAQDAVTGQMAWARTGEMTAHLAAHAQDAALRHSGTGFGPSVARAVSDSVVCLFSNPGMLAAHLLATAVLGWWLARGERTMARLIALFAEVAGDVVRALSWPSDIGGGASPSRSAWYPLTFAVGALAPGGRRWMVTAVARRGPPVLV